jgi:hypothetical protein
MVTYKKLKRDLSEQEYAEQLGKVREINLYTEIVHVDWCNRQHRQHYATSQEYPMI